MTIALHRAEPSDVSFIMECERRPGYELFVGSWTEEKHRSAMEDAAFRYLVASDESDRRGFAILHHSEMRPQNLYLKRVAVHDAGRGYGSSTMSALNDWVFANTDTHRFWLEVVESNPRARHLYERFGFLVEGVVREAYAGLGGGPRGNFVQMSLLKPDWLARKA